MSDLQDDLYLEKDRMAKSNAGQVAKIVRIARELGIDHDSFPRPFGTP